MFSVNILFLSKCTTCVPVGVAQGNAEVPGNSLQSGAGDVDQSCDDNKDVDRSPADDEDSNHYQDHACYSTQVPVLLLCKICVCEGSRWLGVIDK